MGKEGREKSPWDVAQVRYERDVKIEPLAEGDYSLQSITSLSGNYNCADFWIDVPLYGRSAKGLAGWETVWISIWAYDGMHRTLVARKRVGDHEGILLPQRGTDRRVKAILLSVRGRACDGFEVLCQSWLPVGMNYTEFFSANTRLECWGEDGQIPNDDQDRTITAPFAARHKELTKTTLLSAGDNDLLARTGLTPFPDDDKRMYITHVSVYTDEAVLRPLAILRVTGAIRTVVHNAFVRDTMPLIENFTYGLRGDLRGAGLGPASAWLLNIPVIGGGTVWWANCVGFIE